MKEGFGTAGLKGGSVCSDRLRLTNLNGPQLGLGSGSKRGSFHLRFNLREKSRQVKITFLIAKMRKRKTEKEFHI